MSNIVLILKVVILKVFEDKLIVIFNVFMEFGGLNSSMLMIVLLLLFIFFLKYKE